MAGNGASIGPGAGGEFTLGTVVGEIRALARQTEQMETRLNGRLVEVKTDMKELVAGARADLQKQIDGHETRLGKQEKSNSARRWLERAGVVIGGTLAGWFGSKVR